MPCTRDTAVHQPATHLCNFPQSSLPAIEVYNDLNRLSSVNYGDGETQSYAFDAMGNRLTKQDSATGTVNSTYNNANMLLSAGANAYVSDSDGNTLSGGGRTMSWDSENRMTQCVDSGTNSTSSYVYGADGLRRQAMVTANGTTTTTNTIYDATMPVQETTYNPATRQNVLSATYFQGAQGPVYRRDGLNNVSWYVYDGLGSVVEEVSPSGTVTASRKYDVYGAVRSGQAGTSSQKFVGKLGHESDASTGLIYMRARYYDPGTGRFVSQDPKGQGENWFTYCDDAPTNQIDITGKDAVLDTIQAICDFISTLSGNGEISLYTEGEIAGNNELMIEGIQAALDSISTLLNPENMAEIAEFAPISQEDSEDNPVAMGAIINTGYAIATEGELLIYQGELQAELEYLQMS